MATWSTRSTYQNKAVNEGTKEILAALNKLVRSSAFGSEKEDVSMMQGGYNKGGVAASAGTHDGGGAFDLSPFNWKNRVKALRILGCASWHRPHNWDLRGGSEHIHTIVAGDGTASAGAKSQVVDYDADRNGLANRAKDADWRPKSLPILFHLPAGTDLAVRYAKSATKMYDQPNTKGASKGTLAKGAKFTPVAMVKVGASYWVINVDGKCVLDSAVTKTKPGPAKPNILKTTAGITVAADGKATLNISATQACSGWVQIWDDEKGAHVSSVQYYKFAKAGWQPLHFTKVPVISTTSALARVKQETPVDGPNPQWNPLTLKAAPAPLKPMTLRPMTMNLPDEVKIPNAAKRIVAGVAVAKKANPDFVGGQEWVGRNADGTASSHARAIAKAWGTGYRLIIPTLPLNENYMLLKTAAVTLVKQYPDKVIGSRHLTVAVCEDVASGRSFLFGNSQLVNNDHPLAQAQAVLAMAELTRIATLEGGLPIVFTADANTPDDLTAFAKAGLINVRKKAKATTGTQYATYTNQAKTKPSVNVADWTIDQIWCSPEFEVTGYTQVMDLDAKGNFKQPRGSDHVPVLAALTHP